VEEDKNAFMKKLLPLFLTLIFTTVFSQEYHFDYSIETQTNQIKPDKEKSVSTAFYDSKDRVYLNLTKYNNKLRAAIYDKDKHLRHSFTVTESKGSVVFKYTHTNDFSTDKHKSFSTEDIIEVTKIDSLKYQIIAFKNERKRKKRLTALITLEKSNFNYLEVYLEHSKTDEMGDKLKKFLDPNSNYIIKNMQLDYSKGYSADILFKIDHVDFSLKLPEKLIIKDFDFLREFQE